MSRFEWIVEGVRQDGGIDTVSYFNEKDCKHALFDAKEHEVCMVTNGDLKRVVVSLREVETDSLGNLKELRRSPLHFGELSRLFADGSLVPEHLREIYKEAVADQP